KLSDNTKDTATLVVKLINENEKPLANFGTGFVTSGSEFISGPSYSVGSFLIEGWFKRDDVPITDTEMLFYNGTNAESGLNSGQGVYITTDGKIALIIGSITATGSNYEFPNNEWVHVALKRDGSNISVLVNGEVVTVNNWGFGFLNGSFSIGKSQVNTNQFKGKFDEVRFWNIAKSNDEIKQNSTRSARHGEANLLLVYN